MCTVTYIASQDQGEFILTSNRDERSVRETLAPDVYSVNDQKLCFPKDAQAGGSWIATNENGRLCCLLNGGFEKHKKQFYHTVSRGKILLEVTSYFGSVEQYFRQKKLKNVEPFTLITVEFRMNEVAELSEFVWDGKYKSFRYLNKTENYIWSSATLYNEKQRSQRRLWFHEFLKQGLNKITSAQAFEFHSGSHTYDITIDLVMERDNDLKTVSITQVTPNDGKLVMEYADLLRSNRLKCAV